MKKKLLSTVLACIIITMTFAASVPVLGIIDYDAEAAAQGYVARILDAEAAYDGGSFTGYYKFLDSVCSAGYTSDHTTAFDAVSQGQTITLIADADMRGASTSVNIDKNNVTIEGAEGKDVTIYRLGNFLVDAKNLTFKNVNFSLEKDSASFFSVKNNGTLNLNGCTFTYNGTLKYGLLQVHGSTLNLTDCKAYLGEYNSETGTYSGVDVSDTNSIKTALIWSSTENSSVTLDGFEADITSSPEVYGISFEKGGTVKMLDTALTTTDHSLLMSGEKSVKLDIGGASRVMSESGDAVHLNGITGRKTVDITISDSSSIVGGLNGINAAQGKYDLSIELSESASVTGELRGVVASALTGKVSVIMNDASAIVGNAQGLVIEDCSGDVYVEMNGDSRINSDNDGVFICGKNGKLDFVMSGTSSVSSVKNGLDISDENNALQPISISMNDSASINSSTAILIGSMVVTLDVNDYASLNADIPYDIDPSNEYSTITVEETANISTVAPTVKYGASIRISEGANGIRFSSSIDSERIANAKDHGILLVKYEELASANAEFTIYSMNDKGVTYGMISALADNGSGISENDDGTLSFTIVLTDLPEDQLTTKFAVRAYAVYNVNGTDVYVYSDFSEAANVRSMANVAYTALNDLRETKDEANGYIYEIETGKWSCYTKTQYQIISETYGDVAETMANT